MAFDAAAPAVPPPAAGASAAAKPAGRGGDASDPFGALLAMLDQANAETPAPKAAMGTAPSSDEAQAPAAPKAEADETPAPDGKTEAAPAADASVLVAAMMVPAPPPAAVSPVATVKAPEAAAAPPPAAQPSPAVVAATEPPAPAPEQPDASAAPVEPQPPDATAQAEPVALPAGLAAEPAQKVEKPEAPAADQTRVAEAPRLSASHAEARQDSAPDPNAQNHRQGAPSDADAAQPVEARTAATPEAVQQAAALDAPEAAPQGTAPNPPPPPAPAAAAPAITAQAAAMPVRGSPETVAHLAAQMIQRLDGQTTRFDLSLNPQSLGRVDVRIEIGAKGALKARMAFDDAATARELSGRHAELRAALQSAGFDVPEGAITYDVAANTSGGSGFGGFAERHENGARGAPAFADLSDTADQDPAAVVKTYFSGAGSSGVDIRV